MKMFMEGFVAVFVEGFTERFIEKSNVCSRVMDGFVKGLGKKFI